MPTTPEPKANRFKFRAWHRRYKTMFEVKAIYFADQCVEVEATARERLFFNFSEIELIELTGLLDKNGVKIYEGDILRHLDEAYRVDEIIPLHRHTHVTNIGFWYNRQYQLRSANAANDNHDDWMSWPEEYEVIGNIYENPELLPQL